MTASQEVYKGVTRHVHTGEQAQCGSFTSNTGRGNQTQRARVLWHRLGHVSTHRLGDANLGHLGHRDYLVDIGSLGNHDSLLDRDSEGLGDDGALGGEANIAGAGGEGLGRVSVGGVRRRHAAAMPPRSARASLILPRDTQPLPPQFHTHPAFENQLFYPTPFLSRRFPPGIQETIPPLV
eukprot:754582-Hanusia_phi.AAC.4